MNVGMDREFTYNLLKIVIDRHVLYIQILPKNHHISPLWRNKVLSGEKVKFVITAISIDRHFVADANFIFTYASCT